jgi:hypothetical protein
VKTGGCAQDVGFYQNYVRKEIQRIDNQRLILKNLELRITLCCYAELFKNVEVSSVESLVSLEFEGGLTWSIES